MSEHPAVHSPVHVDERSISVAYGHAIANVDWNCRACCAAR